MNALLARLKRIPVVKFTFDVFERFGKDNGGLLAAGLAFFLVLAFVPLLLVGLWALGLVFANRPDEALQKIVGLLQSQVFPGAAGHEVQHLMARAGIAADEQARHAGPTLINILRGHGVAGLVGLAGVVWAAIQIFINGSTAMNAAWETQEKRNWFALRGVALALLVGVGVLLVLSLAVTAFSTYISGSRYAHEVPFQGAIVAGLVELGAVIVSGLMYAVIYKFLPSPSANVSWRAALVGGAVAAVAFEIAKKGLSVWLIKPNKTLYSELGDLIAFILWVYYSMMILLLGATVCAVYASEIEGGRVLRLKKAAAATPAAESDAPAGSPLSRAKQRDRAQRIRRTGRKEGEQSRRR
jgi:membrane protein